MSIKSENFVLLPIFIIILAMLSIARLPDFFVFSFLIKKWLTKKIDFEKMIIVQLESGSSEPGLFKNLLPKRKKHEVKNLCCFYGGMYNGGWPLWSSRGGSNFVG